MLIPKLSTVPGSPEAKRQIKGIGIAIGASWLFVTVVNYLVSFDVLKPYALGSPEGFVPVQIISYSFLHFGVEHLIFDLLWLWGLVNISRHCLATDGFVRSYSLGTAGGGLTYLFFLWLFVEQIGISVGESEGLIFFGGHLGLLTMLAAYAVLRPDLKLYFLGETLADLLRRKMGVIIILLIIGFFISHRDIAHYPNSFRVFVVFDFVITYGLLIWISIAPRTVKWIAIVLILSSLAFSLAAVVSFPGANLVRFLTKLAGLVAGVLYGLFEKLWARIAKSH